MFRWVESALHSAAKSCWADVRYWSNYWPSFSDYYLFVCPSWIYNLNLSCVFKCLTLILLLVLFCQDELSLIVFILITPFLCLAISVMGSCHFHIFVSLLSLNSWSCHLIVIFLIIQSDACNHYQCLIFFGVLLLSFDVVFWWFDSFVGWYRFCW